MAEHLELFPLFPGGENHRMPVGVIGQYKINNVARNRLSGRLGPCTNLILFPRSCNAGCAAFFLLIEILTASPIAHSPSSG